MIFDILFEKNIYKKKKEDYYFTFHIVIVLIHIFSKFFSSSGLRLINQEFQKSKPANTNFYIYYDKIF